MANALYDKGREGFLDGSIDWDNNDIRVVLVDTNDYGVDLANDIHLDSIDVAARVATSDVLTGKTKTAGIANADNITFLLVTGDECEALVVYQDTGDEATSRLIAYIDDAVGLPITPNGGNIIVQWDTGINKIFKL